MKESAFLFYPLLFLVIPLAFILGSIPFGIIFTKSKGIDPRTIGSGNIGATNVLRSAGKSSAVLTLLGDALKGTTAIILCRFFLLQIDMSAYSEEFALAAEELWLSITGISVVVGHMFSIFLSFKGGKGVATAFGVLVVHSPPVAGITLLIWVLVAVVLKYSSMAAVVSIGALPFVFAFMGASLIKIIFAIILTALILVKHKSNIRKLLDGTETKI